MDVKYTGSRSEVSTTKVGLFPVKLVHFIVTSVYPLKLNLNPHQHNLKCLAK